jgi:hypothetical protein
MIAKWMRYVGQWIGLGVTLVGKGLMVAAYQDLREPVYPVVDHCPSHRVEVDSDVHLHPICWDFDLEDVAELVVQV